MALPETVVAMEATYIRGGIYGNANYVSDEGIWTKEDVGNDFDREALARWDTRAVKGKTNFQAELRAYVIRAVNVDREICIDQLYPNLWQANTVTWNNFNLQLKHARISCKVIGPSDQGTWVVFPIHGSY